MKRLLMIAIFLSPAAFAECPDLTGQYECQSQGEIWSLDVSQSTDPNGVTTFYDSGEEYVVADGELRSVPDEDVFRNTLVQGYCEEGSLVIDLRADMVNEGQDAGRLEMNMTYSLSQKGDLVQFYDGIAYATDGSAYPFQDLVTCTRK